MIISELPPNPFVGLRPFESHEGLLFFGRREQTVSLMQQLHHTSFLAVVGSSGCGKSSLIRAGLIPKLKAGFLAGERDNWLMAMMKPGDTPLQNLAATILEATTAQQSTTAISKLTSAIRTNGAPAITEYLAPVVEKAGANVLLVVDQFEEIFRFSADLNRQEGRYEAADFVSIMLALVEQCVLPIYVVMTMRSDFLGDCDAFYGLPEAMNRSQYLVPRLTRQQRQQAIEGPIRLYGEKITPRLLDRILNDAGDKSDQLPIMQHALMRTWERWSMSKSGPLDIGDYEAVGTMDQALSIDADEALEGMSPEDAKLTEKMFQALTDTDPQNRQTRRPANLSEVATITGASPEKILEVVERFRQGGRSFINVYEDKLKKDYLIDISHESLIRQWEKLRRWVEKEAESRTIYLRVADAAVRHKARLAGLWRNPDLQQAVTWRKENRPSRAWARRHHPENYDDTTFDCAMTFLDKSRRRQWITYALFSLLVLLSVIGVIIVSQSRSEQIAFRKRLSLIEEERRLAEKRIELATNLADLNEARLRQADELTAFRIAEAERSAAKIREVEHREAEQRIQIAEAARKETDEINQQLLAEKKKTDEINQQLLAEKKKTLEEQIKREQAQLTIGQLTEEVKDLAKINPPGQIDTSPDFALSKQLQREVRWRVVDDQGNIEFLDDWDDKNIGIVEVPELKGLRLLGGSEPFSGRIRFYKPAIPQLLAAFKEIRERGLLDRITSWGGSYVPRLLRGSSSRLSDHSLGLSFDINAENNPRGRPPVPAGGKGSVVELVPIFQKYGFYWGGSRSFPDPMHFEVIRIVNPQS